MTNKYCNPKIIKAKLDAYVMGQEKGTKAIAMAVAQHLLQIEARENFWYEDRQIPADNVLLVGPTGCGKTETVRALQRIGEELGVPVAMFNTLDYSGNGSWRNSRGIATIFSDVFMKAADIFYEKNGDAMDTDEQQEGITKIANQAIVVLDEFDKIALMGEDNAFLFLREYQSILLKVLEGNTYDVQNFTHTRRLLGEDGNETEEYLDIENNKVDTTNMMFILMGAFSGIEDITKYRLQQERLKKQHKYRPSRIYQDTRLGFFANLDNPPKQEYTYKELIPSDEDIIQYGVMRELVGRIPVKTVYKPLTAEAMIEIMLHCKTSAYREYQRRFRQVGLELKCNRDALREIAKTTIERGTGARGLRTVFEELLYETRYDLSGTDKPIRCLMRGKEIRDGKPPLLHDRTKLIEKRRQLRRIQYERMKRYRESLKYSGIT